MTLREIYRAGITFWFGNHYKLDAYVLRDGKKHPFAPAVPICWSAKKTKGIRLPPN
mgnify:CR=1 FL=1